MHPLTFHALVAAELTSERARELLGSTRIVPVIRSPKKVPVSVGLRVEVNTALKPPRLYIFEVDGTNDVRIVESADVLSVSQGELECPELSILSVRGDKLKIVSIITSRFLFAG